MLIPEMTSDQMLKLIFFILIIIGSIIWMFRTKAKLRRSCRKSATIFTITQEKGRFDDIYHSLKIEYKDDNNMPIHTDILLLEGGDKYQVGDTLEILYDPTNPYKPSHTVTFKTLFYYPLMIIGGMIIGLAFLADEIYGLAKIIQY